MEAKMEEDPRAAVTWIYAQSRRDDIREQYDMKDDVLGKGFFGEVFTATHNASGQLRAIKMLSKLQITDEQKSFLTAEIAIASECDHPNIIKMYEVYETRTDLFLVLELCTGGDLFGELENQIEWETAPCCFRCCPWLYFTGDNQRDKRPYSEQDAARYIQQILQGVAYLHKKNIVHCDLHMRNILFADEKLNSPLKLIDFGLSQKLATMRPDNFLSSPLGIVQYQAPEMLRGKYRQPCDMWSLGVITYHLLFGSRPFNFKLDPVIRRRQVANHLKTGFIPEVREGRGPWFPEDLPVSEAARSFIARLLVMDPVERLTAEEALDHPWISGDAASTVPINNVVLSNLLHVRDELTVEKGLLLSMTSLLDEDELKQLKTVFSTLDYTKDGKITFQELSTALTKLQQKRTTSVNTAQGTLETLARSLKKHAHKNTQQVTLLSYDDLLGSVLYQKLLAKKERLWRAFDALDLDRSGHLHLSELEKVVGPKDAKELMAKYDKDGKGLDVEEFLSIWEGESKAELEEAAPAARVDHVELTSVSVSTFAERQATRMKLSQEGGAEGGADAELVYQRTFVPAQDLYKSRPDVASESKHSQ